MAENGTITIAYRGAGGSYVGETVVFDGRNTCGNTTLLSVTGPGLPSAGVPVNNLNGPAGTATSVEVDQYGAWKFVWYASIVPGIEKMKTARYTFTATDSRDPGKSATSIFMLKKPEYSVLASPDPVNPGKYVELTGTAEQGITFAKIEVKDSSGRVLHTFTSPVSSSGYFNYGFHVDMDPGQYPVTVSNPSLKAPFGTVISVVPEEGTEPVAAVPTPVMTPVMTQVTSQAQLSAIPTAAVTFETTAAPVSPPVPTKSPGAPVTILAALIVGIVAFGFSRRS